MPNFDGGHYFLTTMAPIRLGSPEGLPEDQRAQFEGDQQTSFTQRVQAILAEMPTALQSPATQKIGVNSPFSKSLRTHLCRFVVIEDTVYNGRTTDNALLSAAGVREKPLVPKHIDALPCAYLMFVVDFDAVKEPGTPLPDSLTELEQNEILDDYLESMWALGSAELMKVYENCQGFDASTIKTPADFAAYMRKCQIETWMSFNDYYIDPPELKPLPTKLMGLAVGLPLLATVFFGLAWLFGFPTALGMASGKTALVAGLLLAAALYGVIKYINVQGMKAWPAAKYGDLPSVLKGLYVQQNFSEFAIAQQGATPEERHAAFGQFLKTHKPEDVLDRATTQSPGVISS